MLDLKPQDLAEIQKILKEYIPQMTVWAYGSRVNGTAHSGSDLDLVIKNPQDPSLRQEYLYLLRDAFVESNLPMIVYVLDWAVIPEAFHQEILKKYVVIQ